MTISEVKQRIKNEAIAFATQGYECLAKEDVLKDFVYKGVHITASVTGIIRTSITEAADSAFCKLTSQEIETIVTTICTNRVTAGQDCTREDMLGAFPLPYKNQIISSTSSNGAFVKSMLVNLPEELFLRVQQKPEIEVVNNDTEQQTVIFISEQPTIITNSSTYTPYTTPEPQDDGTTSNKQSLPPDQQNVITSEPQATEPNEQSTSDVPSVTTETPQITEGPQRPTESERDTDAPTEQKKIELPTEAPTQDQNYDGVMSDKEKDLLTKHVQDSEDSIVPYLIVGGVALTVALVGLCIFSPFKFKNWYCSLAKCKKETSITYGNVRDMSIYSSSPESPTGITVEQITTPYTKDLASSAVSEFEALPPRTPPLATTPIKHSVGNVDAPRSPLQVINSRTPPPLYTTDIHERHTLIIEQPSHFAGEQSHILWDDLQSSGD